MVQCLSQEYLTSIETSPFIGKVVEMLTFAVYLS